MTTQRNCGTCKHGFCARTPTGRPKKGAYVDCQVPQSTVKDVMLAIKSHIPAAYWSGLSRADVWMHGMNPTDGAECTFWEPRQ